MQSLEIVTILRKEVAEKIAEFENSDNLKKLRKSQCPISLLKVLLCYRPNFLMQSLKIATIVMKEVNPSVD